MSNELKPCPFCQYDGEREDFKPDVNKVESSWRSDEYHVGCRNCGATSQPSDTIKEAIELWNTHTAESVDVEGLKHKVLKEWGGNGIDRPSIEDMEWVVEYLAQQGYLSNPTPPQEDDWKQTVRDVFDVVVCGNVDTNRKIRGIIEDRHSDYFCMPQACLREGE